MNIRYLEYLIALDQERHFARAAALCNVSQPTLSAGLVALETQLGQRLVERDRRFIGLTAEGAAVLPWARQMVAAHLNLITAAARADSPLTGEVRIGCIPAAMPVVGHLAQELQAAHPDLSIFCQSLTSEAILRGIRTFELDAGLTYVDHDALPKLTVLPLYRDRFLLLTQAWNEAPGRGPTTISEAVERRLCLLPKAMQNRRILDERLAQHGCTTQPAITADSFDALFAIVATGGYSTFIPESYRSMVPPTMRALSITPELPASTIGLVVPDRDSPSTSSRAILDVARNLTLPAEFKHL